MNEYSTIILFAYAPGDLLALYCNNPPPKSLICNLTSDTQELLAQLVLEYHDTDTGVAFYKIPINTGVWSVGVRQEDLDTFGLRGRRQDLER